MNRYEILIFNIKDSAEMEKICLALYEAELSEVGDDGEYGYLLAGKPHSVAVDPSEVAEAVEVINALGYETDEDGQK